MPPEVVLEAAEPASHQQQARQLTQQFRQIVARNSSRWKLLTALEGLGLTVASLLAYLWLAFWLDNVVHLPQSGRVAASLVFLAALLISGLYLFRRWRQLRLSEDQVALAIERRTPGGVENRLINSLQIARTAEGGESDLNLAVIEENVASIRRFELEQATAMRPAFVRLAVAAALILTGCLFYWAKPDLFSNAAARILLPFANVEPLYRTNLSVEPGDVEALGDVVLTIEIRGEQPEQLTLLEDVDGKRRSESIPVPAGEQRVQFTLKSVRQTMLYAVSANDYTTRFYRITVPSPSLLSLLKCTYHYPSYTGLADKKVERAWGDLEAIAGARADFEMVLDQPCAEAALLVESEPAGDGKSAPRESERAPLRQVAPNRFAGSLLLGSQQSYRLETRQAERSPHLSRSYSIHVVPDREPQLDLTGLEGKTEVNVDATLPLRLSATDDLGLNEVGVFVHRVDEAGPAGTKPAAAQHAAVQPADAQPAAAMSAMAQPAAFKLAVYRLAAAKRGGGKHGGGKHGGGKNAAAQPAPAQPPAKPAPAVPAPAKPAAAKPAAAKAAAVAEIAWKPVEVWPGEGKTAFERSWDLTPLALNASEGDQLDIVLRATDRDPNKAGHWTTGVVYHLKVGGDSAALQLAYEQILRSETDLKQLVSDERRVLQQAGEWVRKLDDSKWRGDDPKNIELLLTGVALQSEQQTKLNEQAGAIARAMVEQAGNLRVSVAMLADTEMARVMRIYASVPTRDQPQARRAALSDAQITEQRVVNSLQQMVDQYARFRHEWELSHMIGFVKMLAERQAGLHDLSIANADRPRDKVSELRQASARRRQEKLLALTGLSRVALAGLGTRTDEVGAPLAAAFAAAADSLNAADLTGPMQRAAAEVDAAKWREAAVDQAQAADRLAAIHAALRKAQIEAARQALASLEEDAKSNVEAQAELKRLQAGDDKAHFKLPEKLTPKEIVHMKEMANDRRNRSGDQDDLPKEFKVVESKTKGLQNGDDGRRQQFKNLSLDNRIEKSAHFPDQADREANHVVPIVQEQFEDLVGTLLDEADEMSDKYDTINMNAASTMNETGAVGKLSGDLNSTAAAAATGNKKPPTTNVGGASRNGRQGARSHGTVVGDDAVNRRGRDKAQEGQERVPDQDGVMKETKSDDPQLDTSTGVGGKRVESDETKFSTGDSGKWTDDMARRMVKSQEKNYIVERLDGRFDHRLAESMREMTGDHEQLIERVKAIRKELKNLYLPTEPLDEILADLKWQLDRLKEKPSPELFRLERQTLDKLRGVLQVFHQAHAGFQASLPRRQVVRDHVLDEAGRPPLPGYEQAVKRYYEKLSTGGNSRD